MTEEEFLAKLKHEGEHDGDHHPGNPWMVRAYKRIVELKVTVRELENEILEEIVIRDKLTKEIKYLRHNLNEAHSTGELN